MTEFQPNQEHEASPYEINVGDVMYVKRNLRDEKGDFLRDDEGKVQKKLEDGWEVVDTAFPNPNTGKTEVLLRNTANPRELKPVPEWRLREIQDEAEEKNDVVDVESLAPSVAAGLIEEIDQRSGEIADEEPRLTKEQVEEIGEEGLDAAGVDDPSEAENQPEAVSLAEMMSGEKKGSLKFDLEAAKARIEAEAATRLIPEKDLNTVRSTAGEMLRQFDIMMHASPAETAYARGNLEAALVLEANRVAEQVRRGDMDPLAAGMLEGFIAGSARTPDALSEIVRELHHSHMYDDADMRKIETTLAELQNRIIQQGSEGEHFGDFSFAVDRQASVESADNEHQVPSKAYATLLGISVAAMGRVGPQAQHSAYSRLQGAIDRLHSFKKPEA